MAYKIRNQTSRVKNEIQSTGVTHWIITHRTSTLALVQSSPDFAPTTEYPILDYQS